MKSRARHHPSRTISHANPRLACHLANILCVDSRAQINYGRQQRTQTLARLCGEDGVPEDLPALDKHTDALSPSHGKEEGSLATSVLPSHRTYPESFRFNPSTSFDADDTTHSFAALYDRRVLLACYTRDATRSDFPAGPPLCDYSAPFSPLLLDEVGTLLTGQPTRDIGCAIHTATERPQPDLQASEVSPRKGLQDKTRTHRT